jgi:hypothetical protein
MDDWKNPNFLATARNCGVIELLQKEGLPESFEEAFDILLDGLVSCFGVIPQQVF